MREVHVTFSAMKRLLLPAALLLFAALAVVPAREQTDAGTRKVDLNGHTFTIPAEMEIELVAGPPLVSRPITADFDEEGRLYVAESAGAIDKTDIQMQKKPHRVLRLEDTDGDGKFDKSTVFADKLSFPEGTLWSAGSLYVAAPPSIWKLTDTKGEGVADQRVEWFQGKTLTGCANDLHGPYLGPDGWIYWCKGAFAQQTYERPGKAKLVTRAAHIFRARPDGTGVEPVMTGGMDNPVDVVFTPGGERIFTTTFFQHPGGGKRDGLVHAVYGGIYGKDHDVIYDHPWTSPSLMPVLTHLGPAAPCGLHRYEGKALGREYEDNVFACLFNLHKVTRHVLEPEGATFHSRDEDFVVSSNLDFHPTDVIEDADGSLLILDTGGWYKLCCPTSQLVKPDVPGGIYRVRRKDAPGKPGAQQVAADPRGRKLKWEGLSPADLASRLADPRPAVRRRAIEALATRGAESVSVLSQSAEKARTAEARRNALWALTRIDRPDAREAARKSLADPDETVRQVALHSISLWRDKEAVPALLRILKGHVPHNQRAAAEALGRIGDRSAVPGLLEAVGHASDRVLEHSLTYALIEIADREGTAAGLADSNPLVRRAALTALDQMEGGKLDPKTVSADLGSKVAPLKETAWWIVSRHPEWGGDLAGFFREQLAGKDLSTAEREALARQLARLAKTSAIQQLLTEALKHPRASRETRLLVLHALAGSGLKQTPDAWIELLTGLLTSADAELVKETVTTVRALPMPKTYPPALAVALRALGGSERTPVGVRLAALAAAPAEAAPLPAGLFAFLQARLTPDEPVTDRLLAAEVLAKARLSTEQLLLLAGSLKKVGPMEVNRLLEAFAQSKDEQVGRALLAALRDAPARSAVRVDLMRQRLAKYPPVVLTAAEELYALLVPDLGKQREKLEQLIGNLSSGDVRRGQLIFNSQKASCSACHAVGYLGGTIGPDLTRIGAVRNERDLLESIVFPSSSIVQGFEPVRVSTKQGKDFNGLVKRSTPDEIVLVLGVNQEARIARSDIEEMLPSKLSVMPAGLDQQLTPQELADLVAFLKACR
jgi:putative membrane-bound dehydrogenase-like protein